MNQPDMTMQDDDDNSKAQSRNQVQVEMTTVTTEAVVNVKQVSEFKTCLIVGITSTITVPLDSWICKQGRKQTKKEKGVKIQSKYKQVHAM